MGFSGFFHRRTQDTELAQELEAHIAHQTDENIAAGMSAEEARRQAYLKLGSRSRVREDVWEQNTFSFFDDLWRDFRYTLRVLRRAPGFSLLAILCLTLGIGSTAAVFSWMEGIALRPFPAVAHQDRMVAVSATKPGGDAKGTIGFGYTDASWPDWLDFQRSCTLFDAFIVDRITGSTLNIGDRAQTVTGSVVSSNYFDALGIRPILGRGFQSGEDSGRNAHPVVVISYWLWKDYFRSDPQIVGKTQLLNNVPHTIIGVAPDGFYGTFVGYAMQFWVPASMQETFVPGGYKLEDRGAEWIEGYALLKPGVTIEQAQHEISAVAKRLENDYLATNRGRGVQLNPLWRTPFNQAGNLFPTLEIALAVGLLVLLIACANVSSLLMVKSLSRRHEMTVRVALGSGRARLVKQLLMEGLVLSTIAAGCGLLLGYFCRNALILIFSDPGTTRSLGGQMDWRVFLWSAAACLLSTVVFALAPAFQTGKFNLASALKSESGSVFGGHGKSRVRSAFVVAQICLSFVLLVGAVLLVQSLHRIRTADPGFSTDNVLVSGVNLRSAGYDAPRAKTFQDALLDRVRALGSVESAAWARARPFSYVGYLSSSINVEGYLPAPNERPEAEYNPVSPGYLSTMGILLLSGRDFTVADNETAPLVAIVNEKMASQYWRGADPVGKRFQSQANDQWIRVIGVAKNALYSSFKEAPKSFYYVPFRQSFSINANLHIRTSRNPPSLAPDLIREVRALDANLAPYEVVTMREHILRTALSSQNIAVALVTAFGALALLLAAIGLYGVMAYSVTQSKRELGLRMALGASARNVLRLVLRHGLALTAVGVVIGAVAAFILTRLVDSLLYKVSSCDPLAFFLALAVMTAAALAASFVPAWRATRIDPVRALRD